ncbi:DEAD/DEAH box helicase [Rhodococcus sp. HNM0569]|uniref:DEAD/DEAH box helicase n=1 Tax=Rhodococcus sp. HNM0569 TaxID=2716340 RepID=UPI00146F4624|nr:DEAD/DEAH box helicase [Rhodococcus sp. HNM0569]NLU84432.1 DEAD/DEAH box helicase [Rhodococcus sp. HNM0569]
MLHGLWIPGSGLLVWEDDVAVHTPPAAPSVVDEVLARRKRHTAKVPLPTADGWEWTTQPAVAFAPPDAAALLLAMPVGDARVSGDLRYLAHVVRGVAEWVRAGRVVPAVDRGYDAWWPRWRLVGGEAQRAWSSELLASMPPVQRVDAVPRAVLDDLLGELTDPVVRLSFPARTGTHPFVRALDDATDYPDSTPSTAEAFATWRASLTAGEPALVLRLAEPDDLGDTDSADDTLWRLEVCLRPEGEAPQPIELHRTDRAQLEFGVRKLQDALHAYPRLRDVPSDPGSLDLLLPTAVVVDLVSHGVQVLQDAGIAVLLPRAWTTASPSLRLRVSSPSSPATAEGQGLGTSQIVDYHWELALGDVVLTADEMHRLASAQGDLVRLRGEWVRADADVLARAARYVTERHASGDRAVVDLLAELLEDDARGLPVDEITATGWASALLEPGRSPDPVPSPPGVHATLRPYQQRGLDWLAFMSARGLGAVLADDMGLGKTLQVLALIAHERAVSSGPVPPTLLVCPMSVVGNWQREAARFVPDLRVLVHHGTSRAEGDALAAAVAGSDLVLTTYALLARDIADLKEQPWRRIVLDEAQHVKNPRTAAARAARAVPAEHRLALTGTPVENRLSELRSILDFANRGVLGSEALFRSRFEIPIEREQDAAAAARLRSVTAPFVLRRVKTDPAVISDLPDKLELTVRANLTTEQASLYRAVVDDMLTQIEDSKGMGRKGLVLSTLAKLKQVCNHPAHFAKDGSALVRRGTHRSGKLALVDDILESVLADDEKALLFTQFREFGDMLAPYLAARFGAEVPFLHGGVSKPRRDRMVEEFQDSGGPPIMLLSLKAGGTGLNLTAANHVVHLDRWWNPAVENQATDRAFRIGQRKDVQVRKLVCVGTLEERIDQMIAGKQELADLTVGAGENWITEMSSDELNDLLALGDDAVGE